jgi:hypothetical protein
MRVPLTLDPAELAADELPDADDVVATVAVYLETNGAPRRVTVPFLSAEANSCEAANATLTADAWTSP